MNSGAEAATSFNQTAHNYVSHSPHASVRRTVSQENARRINARGASCTAEDFKRIDQQMAKLEQAGNLAEIVVAVTIGGAVAARPVRPAPSIRLRTTK